MDRSNLERRIAWELAHLPPPAAPPTLLPRVMAAVHAWATRPWYERAWTTWPIGWQVAALSLFAIGAITASMVVPALLAGMQEMATVAIARVSGRVPDLGARLDVISLAAPVLWRALIYRVLFIAFIVVTLMSLACAMVAVVLNRAVFGRAVQS
jgi:hypothetical protein